jgi:type III secretion protein Y
MIDDITADGITDVIDLMHCLGYLYFKHGQPYRAVVLLLVAGQVATERSDILRTLAAALVEAGMGQQALDVLDRLLTMEPELAAHRMVILMRARAQLLAGHSAEARATFAMLSTHTDRKVA